MTIDLEDVCTEAQLAEHLGVQTIDSIGLKPRGWDTCEPARRAALDKVIAALKSRTPPIRDTDLADVTELRNAVLFGAKAHLYELAMSSATEGALFLEKWRIAHKQFTDEVRGLAPTLTDGIRGPAMSFSYARR